MRETGRTGFKASLIKELEARFPGCCIIPMDPNSTFQGIPDLLILFQNKWAMLEVKGSPNAKREPNQPYYVDMFNTMSFGAFIYPENAEEVLGELQQTFQPRRAAFLPEP